MAVDAAKGLGLSDMAKEIIGGFNSSTTGVPELSLAAKILTDSLEVSV